MKAFKLIFVVVIVPLVLFGTIGYFFKAERHKAIKADLKKSAPQLAERIQTTVDKLSAESVGASLTNLADVNLFYWPGPSPNPGRVGYSHLPLNKMVGKADVEAILSNRRFLKVVDEVAKLDRRAVSAMVSSELNRATRDYVELFKTELEQKSQYYRAEDLVGQRQIVGPTFVEGNVKEGEIVIKGLRLKVLSLVWLCGELGLADCRTNVEEVVRIATAQRNNLYKATALHPFFRAQMLETASVYNRQILSRTLLELASPSIESTTMKELGLEWQERKAPNDKAALTEFDLPVRSGVASPDFYLGSRSFKIVAPIDDTSFDQLLGKLGVTF